MNHLNEVKADNLNNIEAVETDEENFQTESVADSILRIRAEEYAKIVRLNNIAIRQRLKEEKAKKNNVNLKNNQKPQNQNKATQNKNNNPKVKLTKKEKLILKFKRNPKQYLADSKYAYFRFWSYFIPKNLKFTKE